MLIFKPPSGIFYKTHWAYQGVKFNQIDVDNHLQKSLDFFDKNSAEEIWSKKYKYFPSCQLGEGKNEVEELIQKKPRTRLHRLVERQGFILF